ncbi:MAG TPA: adenylate/guanylate cyclase domain-containing protein [Gallionella sp.]
MTTREDGRPTVLVVDDTPANLSLLSNLLKSQYRIKVANNGAKALELAASEPPDMVLLDVMMPGLDGFEVCRRLKASDVTRQVPIIFLTAKNETADEELGFSLGAVDFIHKPISPPIVAARVKTHLEIKSLHDALRMQNQFIKKTFGRYMSDEVVNKLLESPDGLKLGGESLLVTIVMADLRGFSAMSEKQPPETVVEMLNSYLSDMTEIIFRHGGTINEIIGDALLVLFGAPTMRSDDADRAIACALEMQLAMEKVNRRIRALDLPDLEMGIGINTGSVVAGNIGSDMRVKYAVVGNNVNLAGRVESFTVGGQVLITESTRQTTSLELTIAGKVAIPFKGLKDPVNVYDVTGVHGAYEIVLPQAEIVFVPLAEEIPLSIEILEGKHSSGRQVSGRISQLARNSAIVCAEAGLKELDNLKVVLGSHGGAGCIIYAKVMKVWQEESNCYELRFTFVPLEVRKYFGEVLHELKGAH